MKGELAKNTIESTKSKGPGRPKTSLNGHVPSKDQFFHLDRNGHLQDPKTKTLVHSNQFYIEKDKLEKKTELDGIRKTVFMDRYSLKDAKGDPMEEHPEQMWYRVAHGLAQVEKPEEREKWAKKFYSSMEDFKFVPAGRILSGAGTGYEVTFYNCFVIPSPPDSRGGIIDNLKIMVEIMSRAGGVGINLSSLRPRGARVKKVNGTASGPVNWAELYSVATHDVIQQGGSRRGALMLMINDWHPDMEEFIQVKQDLSRINGANLSVCVSDAFMEAVKNDGDWDLVYPDVKHPKYDEEWDGDLEKWLAKGYKVDHHKSVKAKEVWDMICQAAWASAEPGLHFIDRSNKLSNTWYFEKLISTNPCGEQPLGAWAVCNLGALNLSNFVEGGKMDYEMLADHTRTAIRMLDNVVDANYYFYKENEEQQKSIRRTGLGTMGLGDALIKMKLPYGSDNAITEVEKIYKTIRDNAYSVSAEIAKEKGAFSKFDKEKYLQGTFIKRLPREVQDKIGKYGIRNAVLLTQAPTGTTSLVSGASSGIEPVYDFAMVRRDRTGEHTLYHPLYEEWKNNATEGSEKPDYFVSANDLSPEEHVRMQATIQYYTDSSISKTVNAPNAHSVDEVKRLYTMAYDLGCKGVTYMRDGSRAGVLSHVEEKPKVEEKPVEVAAKLRHRPAVLTGYTYRAQTPVGEAFITINEDPDGNPFEVFINVGKAGSDITADAEAMGRLMSVALRIPSAYSPQQVAEKIAFQLKGIGGSGALGFGTNRVRSLADAISKVLYEHVEIKTVRGALAESAEAASTQNHTNGATNGNGHSTPPTVVKSTTEMEAVGQIALPLVEKQGDFCPQCGQAKLVFEEGCKKCYACGYSAC